MTPEEIRVKDESGLKALVLELKEELFKLKIQKSVGQLEKTHRLKELKKDVARVKTILNEKAKGEK